MLQKMLSSTQPEMSKSWLKNLERSLEEKLRDFLDVNPGQASLLVKEKT